jgi:UDP-glucose 4-epimerase
MSTVLITGGAGFIGSHLAERLVARGDEVILADNFRRDSLSATGGLREHERVTVRTVDILDIDALIDAATGADTVVHLAAIAGVQSYYNESLRTLEVNILGTYNVLTAAVRSGIQRVIDFSTSEVFGPDALWVDEESGYHIGPVSDRRWVYATSKLAGEQFTMRFSEKHGFAATVLRPFNVYGPRQTGEGAISNFSRAGLKGRPLSVYGDGTPIRAWCFVDDMVDAVILSLDTPAAAGETFNIGNPRETETTLGLARRIAALAGNPGIEFVAMDRAEVRSRVPNIDKARRILGFEPKVDLETGLQRTFEWFRSEVSS